MSDQDNPYKAPETTAATTAAEGDFYLPDPVRIPLLKSAPWMRFLGIAGFIVSGLIALLGVLFMAGMTAVMSAFDMAGLGSGTAIFMGLIYIAMGALYFFPSLYLFRAGSSLKAYRENPVTEDLAASFTNSSKFWKFIGVLAIISLSFTALAIVIMAIAGLASAF